MASSLLVRYQLAIGGSPTQLGNPLVAPFLETEGDPAVYDVTIAADTAATVWEGAPLPSPIAFIAMVANRTCVVEFEVNDGDFYFTLPLPSSGLPLMIPGGASFGTTATFGTAENITRIRVDNTDTEEEATISLLVAKAAA